MMSGRSKETIVLTGGENVEPETLEILVISSRFIADVLLVGHGQKSLGALVLPEFNSVRQHLGLGSDVTDDEAAARDDVTDLMKREARAAVSREKGFRTFEQITRIAVLAKPFNVEDGTLTQSLKKRRAVIEQRYAELIAGLFQ